MVVELNSTPLSFPRTRICFRPPRPAATFCGMSMTARPDLRLGRKYRIFPRNGKPATIGVAPGWYIRRDGGYGGAPTFRRGVCPPPPHTPHPPPHHPPPHPQH